MKYTIPLEVTYRDTVVIEADTLDEARQIAADRWFDINQGFVVDYYHDTDPLVEFDGQMTDEEGEEFPVVDSEMIDG
jgi:hypothetical protein